MTVDISKIKPGDKVTLVPLEVVDVGQDSNYVAARLGNLAVWHFNSYQIAAHHPAPRQIKMGDRVRWADRHGEVIGIDGSEIGVRWANPVIRTWVHRTNLTLVEAGQ